MKKMSKKQLEVLEYLKKHGPTNTFRLAHTLDIDRHKLLNFIQKLIDQGAVEFKSGIVRFLKYPEKRVAKPKPIKIKSPPSKKKKKRIKSKAVETLQIENKCLKEQLKELEENVKKLEEKASTAPKTITKTIIKKVPTPIPPLPKKKKKAKKKISQRKFKTKKFKFPKFKFIKHIKKLKKPEFIRKGGEK